MISPKGSGDNPGQLSNGRVSESYFLCWPISWLEVFGQFRLRRPGFGLVIVVPARDRGQGHEDRFGAAAGFQAEQGAAVVEEVELDVTGAAKFLESPLPLVISGICAVRY